VEFIQDKDFFDSLISMKKKFNQAKEFSDNLNSIYYC